MHKITFTWLHRAKSGEYKGRHTVTVLDPSQAREQAKLEIEAKMAFPKGTVSVWEVTR